MDKQIAIDWYNAHVVAQWYKSAALWVGVLAGLLPFMVDGVQALLDNLGVLSDALALTATQKARLQLFLLVVVLPIARAIRQQTMQDAARRQDMERMQREMALASERLTPKEEQTQ